MAKKKSKAKTKAPVDADVEDLPKPKLRRVREDDVDELTAPKKHNDIFTGLAAISLIALIGAAYFFFQDHEETVAKSLSAPNVTIPSAGIVSDAPKGKN